MKKYLVWIFFIASIVCVGCNGKKEPEDTNLKTEKAQPKEEITLMHVDAEKDEFQEFIKEAEEALDLKITAIPTPDNADNRHAKISTVLSSGEASVDIISVNDEMISEFKHLDYLEPLQGDVMTEEIRQQYPQDYLENIVMADGNVYSVPYLLDVMVFWVNEEYLALDGIEEIRTMEDFRLFLSVDYGDNCYGWGGAWEATYAYNDIFLFINLFGGDYYNWEDENTRAALEFLYQMVNSEQLSKEQLIDQYEQMEQKFIDGKYGSIFMYSGAIDGFLRAGVYGQSQIHVAPLPAFREKVTNIATWQYVLNKASENKEAAKKFLRYAAGKEGSISYAVHMNRLPVRLDILLEEELPIIGYDVLKEYVSSGMQLQPRPLSANAMEDIKAIGNLFQAYVLDQISLEEMCEKAQGIVD